jgi:hypothetical protein
LEQAIASSKQYFKVNAWPAEDLTLGDDPEDEGGDIHLFW